MKKTILLLAILMPLLTKSQNYNEAQTKLGYLFTNIDFNETYESWVEYIDSKKELYKDSSSYANGKLKLYIIKNLDTYKTIIPYAFEGYISISVDTIKSTMIQSMKINIHTTEGTTKKDVRKIFNQLYMDMIKIYEYKIELSSKANTFILFGKRQFETLKPFGLGYSLIKNKKSYSLNVCFQKYVNASNQ